MRALHQFLTGAHRGLALFCAVLTLSVLVSCTRAPDLVGVDNVEKPTRSVTSASRQKIFIMTTREASEISAAFYSSARAPELGLASVVVSIPPNHEAGKLERPARLPPDPETEFAVIEPTVFQTPDSFVTAVNQTLSKLPASDRSVLFFVHGYNNTISDSILRLAQFVEDSGFKGVPVLFSWASAAKPSQYVYDLNSALVARPKLLQASNILNKTRATSFNLFAHSMGAMLTMEAIAHADLRGEFNKSRRLKNIMLAAPDIDLDLFRSQLEIISRNNQRVFVFVSKEDSALKLSRTISGGVSRLGSADASELSEQGITFIDLSLIDNSDSGSHSKFAGSPEVVQLIGEGLKDTGRFGLQSPENLEDYLAGIRIQVVSN